LNSSGCGSLGIELFPPVEVLSPFPHLLESP
jgi:hypothetical protein